MAGSKVSDFGQSLNRRKNMNGIYDYREKSISEILIALAYCFFVVVKIIDVAQVDSTFLTIVVKVASYISFFVLMVSFALCYSFSRRFLITSVIVLPIGFLSAVMSGELSSVFLVALFMLSGYLVKTDYVIKCYIIIASVVVGGIVLLFCLGILPYEYTNVGGRFRLKMGFEYTTYLANFFFHILLAYCAVKKKNIGIVETIVILIINYVIMALTDTRAAFASVLLLIFLLWMVKAVPFLFETKLFKVGMIISMPIFAVTSICTALFYNGSISWMSEINEIVTGRLFLGNKAINMYGISLIGQPIEWNTDYVMDWQRDFQFVDSSYLNIALNFGILLLVIIVFGFTYLMFKAMKEKKYVLCIAILMLGLHSLSDPQLFELRYNPFLIYIGTTFISGIIPLGFTYSMRKTHEKKKLDLRKKDVHCSSL